VVSGARTQAAAIAEQAQTEAAALVEDARVEGRASAATRIETELSEAHRDARQIVLDAEQDVDDLSRTRAVAVALAFRTRPEYGRLLDVLEGNARRRLGAGAEIERDAAAGGIRARLGRRSLDYTLPSLAEHALADVLTLIDAGTGPSSGERAEALA